MDTQSKIRCPWCLGFDQYVSYHDEEWGVPVYDDKIHFEFLVLESAQAGLSWATILKKREGYRNAFADFDYKVVADFPDSYVEELLHDPGIIRNKLKIKAAINNAQRFMEVQQEFGSFSDYIWSFVGGKPIQNKLQSMKDASATSAESDRLAKDLKKRGFKFLGSTTIYAHMQATGLVNDHLVDCFRHSEVKKLQGS
ncbi:MAG TPA: DNA-3-methyladenine glycosylase I [Algoriphagus sp.]|jgi:DNA-3-methyladenine glycosylase I|uniref:DNA-3-methyladenine glycosylase I n=1 Tax=unclassified Algoriphagus TaxID=2641541 RepID=UPI000C5A9803|nr:MULTISPECIES: DNA-3-methyladenine glycosylase I [unclassified Algoriphagus]MAL15437.1 DNA-3-methyladenine glycosylase I [Algoriphagus sp.]MAN86828.1 DNA-3-methyladenine glycosylase I [Algoriphagus sp.]QYH40383.1 DNA-3-methyladenine glycosylase I [Algoriphagus sp. NBT04N3]HAH35503.1 DNA-3-methyladenine glycosylase I [Algoriphagus sp.]HAS59562.1 DNA-3-methyladenine glycosylase I [Algoriphagus sp.]|tara:strand:+ start:10035 stop:10625 length:591 start_codon:yes stop_codon:yes gene_type:complete